LTSALPDLDIILSGVTLLMTMQLRGFALLACVAAFSAAPLLPQTDGIAWFEDYREALREAKQTHKPILVEFRCEP